MVFSLVPRRPFQSLLLALLAASIGQASLGQTVWSGGGANDNWTNPQNWSGGIAPPLAGANTYLQFQGNVRLTPFADAAPWILNRVDFAFGQTSFTVSGAPLSFQGATPQVRSTSQAPQTVNNDIGLPSADLAIEGGAGLTLAGHISSNNYGIVITGPVTLSNSNGYAGTTTIGANSSTGSLLVQNATALGASFGGTVLKLSSQLRLSGGITISSEPLSLSSGSGFGKGLISVSGNNTWTGPITLGFQGRISSESAGETLTVSGSIEGGGYLLQLGGAGDLVISGPINNVGTAGLMKDGTGTLTLSGMNSNLSLVLIENGTLAVTNSNALPPSTPVQLNPNSFVPLQDAHPILQLGQDMTIGDLSGGNYGGFGIIQLGSHNLSISQGLYSSYAGKISGTGMIIKGGPGILELDGTSDYSGGTTLSSGPLRLGADASLGAVPASPSLNVTIFSGDLQAGSVPVTLHPNRTIMLISNATMTSFIAPAPLIVQGKVTGSGTLTKAGDGLVTLTNPNNNYGGGTSVNAGTLKLDLPGAIPTFAAVTVNAGGTAAVGYAIDQSFLTRIQSSSTGVIALAANSSNDLDLAAAGLTSVHLGAFGTQSYSGTLTPAGATYRLGGADGTLNLTRLHALTGTTPLEVGLDSSVLGKVLLSNDNSLNANTLVRGGILEVSASTFACNQLEVRGLATLQLTNATVASNVTIDANGFLAGCGTINGNLTNIGTGSINCAMGLHVTGTLTNNGTLSILNSSTLIADGYFVNNGLLDLLTSPGTHLPPGFVNNGTVVLPGVVKTRSLYKSGTFFALTIQSLPGHNYQLQRNSALAPAGWQNVDVAQAGNTGADLQFFDPASSGSRQFYRIQISP